MQRHIASLEDITALGPYLEGASIEELELVPQGDTLCLRLGLTRACREQQHTVRQGLITRMKTPWTKSRLSVEGIAAAGIASAPQAAGREMPLLWCAPEENRYTLRVTSPEGLQLRLTLARLQGEFADVGELIEAP